MQNLSYSGRCYKGDSLEVDGVAYVHQLESMVSVVVYLTKKEYSSECKVGKMNVIPSYPVLPYTSCAQTRKNIAS